MRIVVIGFTFSCKTGKRNRLVWEEYAKLYPKDEIHILTGKKYLWDNWSEILPPRPASNLFIYQLPSWFSSFGQFKYLFPTMLFKLRFLDPDIVLALEEPIQPFVTWIASLYAKMNKKPFFCYTYENQEKDWYFPFSFFENVSVKNSEVIVCATNKASDLIIKDFPKASTAVFPQTGVDTSIFKKTTLWKKRKNILLFTGRFLPEKGFAQIIEAKKILEQRGKYYRWLFIGSGPMESLLIEHVKNKDNKSNHSRKIQGNLEIINWISPEDLVKYYNKAKLFLYPSLQTKHWEEQFGYSMVESLACGTPVISTPNTGAKEILPDKNFFVPFADPKALADKIEELINSNKEYDFSDYIEKRFSTKAIAKRWHDLFATTHVN